MKPRRFPGGVDLRSSLAPPLFTPAHRFHPAPPLLFFPRPRKHLYKLLLQTPPKKTDHDAPCGQLLAFSPFASCPSSLGSLSTWITVRPPFSTFTPSTSLTPRRQRSRSSTAAGTDEKLHHSRSLSGKIILRVRPVSFLWRYPSKVSLLSAHAHLRILVNGSSIHSTIQLMGWYNSSMAQLLPPKSWPMLGMMEWP